MTKPDVESAAAEAVAVGSEENVADGNWRARLAELWRLYRQSAPDTLGKLIASCAMGLVASLLPLALVFVAALLADRAAGTAGGGFVGWASKHDADELAVFLGLVALVASTALYFEMIWFAELGSFAAVELRKRVFGSLISLPLGFFAGSRMEKAAEMVEADLGRVHSAWTSDWRFLWRSFLVIVATMIVLFMIEPRLAGTVLGLLVVIAALLGWLLKISPAQDGTGMRVFCEAVQLLASLKSFANENHERGRLRHALAKSSAAEQRRTRWRSGVLAVGGLLVAGVVIYYLWFRAQQIAKGNGSFEAGRTLAFVLLTAVFAASTARLVLTVVRLSGSGEAAQRLALILTENSEQLENGPYLPDSRGRLEGRVEFDKVSCSADGAISGEAIAVMDFHLKIKSGQTIALVGVEGSGSALLLELMLGFHELDSGEIKFDGRALSDYPLAWLRSQIGWLPREPQFFSASVAENISYGRPDASQKEIRQAAEQAGALEFIEKLADGFETMMPVRASNQVGVSLNRDQRHRLALARIFLEDPPLLAIEGLDPGVVDTAKTSSGGQRAGGDVFPKIAEAEDRLISGRTTLVVAKRLSAARNADMILVMKRGRMEEQGTHADLYEAKGFYRLLCEGPFGHY